MYRHNWSYSETAACTVDAGDNIKTEILLECKINYDTLLIGAPGSVAGWGTMLQAGRSPVRVPNEMDVFHSPNPSSRTMALGSTQHLTDMITRNLPGGKKRPRVGLTTLPPSVSRMSENAGASTSRNPKGLHGLYRDNFTFTFTLAISDILWK
jgi:hypothetical protein